MSSDMHRILVVAPIPPELRARLGKHYELVEHRFEQDGKPTPPAPGFKVAVTTSIAGFDADEMAALPDLRLVLCNGTGLEKIDLEAVASRNITVRHTPDVVTEDTADFAIGLMYAVSRRMVEADRFVRSGGWKTGRMTPSRRLYDRTLGVVGLGKIGSAIARRAAGIGLEVLYTGRNEKPDTPHGYVGDIGTLAERADIVVLSCPGGAETRHLVNADMLRRLGPDGILINVSRGSVVDEAALLDALESNTIAAAGLDVFSSEPDIDSRFMALDNVVLQPHYAAVTRQTREAMADVLENAVDGFFSMG